MEFPEGAEYVALGSSYAAGPGLGDRVPGSPRAAGRSMHSYAHILSERLKLRLTDATFSGATVAQILGTEPGALLQLEGLTTDTRLVTLTGGGNDVGYIGYLVTASMPSLLRTVTGGHKRLVELSDDDAFEAKESALGDNLIALFDEIRARAPKATIAVTDYLTLLPPDDSVGAPPLRREDIERGRRYFQHVNLTLRQAAARAGVLFAEVSAASASHHAWSSDPWTERFVLFGGKAAPYHPNRAGMVKVADELDRLLSGA
jgi:lysophospholipase L1-like esterase